MASSTGNGTVTLKPVGDVELWYAEGQDKSWRLPFHLEWKVLDETGEMFAYLMPAVCFYESQLIAVNALLAGYAIPDKHNRWLVPREHLPLRLSKAPGINAPYYYYWPSGVHPPIPSVHHQLNFYGESKVKIESYEEFSEFISKERGIPSDVVTVVLNAICQLAPRWLLERREPLHLGFVKLVALPFRTNWKEIVAFKMKIHPLLQILSAAKEIRHHLLERIGFPKVVASTHNTGLRVTGPSKHRLHYTIEAIPTAPFERKATEIESERMKPGETSYVGHFEWTVQKQYDSIIEAMAHYLKKTCCPWGGVRIGRTVGVCSFYPRSRRAGKLSNKISIDTIPVHILPPDPRFSVFAESPTASDPTLLYPENATLPALSAVPSSPYDVRIRNVKRDMDESRQVGAARVPLLDAGESVASRERLLSGDSTTEPDTSRVDHS